MIKIKWKNIIYFFLIFPFIQPGIFSIIQALTIIDTIYDIWLATSVIVILFMFMRFHKFNSMLVVVSLYLVWCSFSTLIKGGSLLYLFVQYGSILALGFLIHMSMEKREDGELLEVIVGLLEFYLIINAITVFIYAPQGGIVSDIESISMKTNNYFLGYDNQHVYFILPYFALSLVQDIMRCNSVKIKTIIVHIIVNASVLICWSADTVISVVLFYLLLLTAGNRYVKRLINSYVIIIANAILFYFLVVAMFSSQISVLIENILHKNMGSARQWIWIRYLSYVYKSPVIGNGYLPIFSRYSLNLAAHAHNMYLDVLFVSGLVGLALFITVVYLGTNSGKRITINEQMIVIIAIIAYVIAFQGTAKTYCPTFFLLLFLSYEFNNMRIVYVEKNIMGGKCDIQFYKK